MENHKKTISGYLCEVEIDNDNDPITDGWISKGRCSGSIASVLNQGCIATPCGSHQYEIPDNILHHIEDWAHSVGY